MNAWEILGIAPTQNVRAIKRAYARQLAQHHPEEDQEGYQLVQAAYERALAQARAMEAVGASHTPEEVAAETPPPVSPISPDAASPAEPVESAAAETGRVDAAAQTGRERTRMPHADALPHAERQAPTRDASAPSRPRMAQPDGVFADVEAEAAATGDQASVDYVQEKLLRDAARRERAAAWLADFERQLQVGDGATAYVQRHPVAEFLDDEGFDRALANALRNRVSRLDGRHLDELERAVGFSSRHAALNGLFERRRADLLKQRRDKRRVVAAIAFCAVIMSVRLTLINQNAANQEELQQKVEDARKSVDASRDLELVLPDSRGDEDALAANVQANRKAIEDHLLQELGEPAALEDDPAFVPGSSDRVLAMATVPDGTRYAVFAHVDEGCLIDEVTSVTPVEDDAA